MYKTEYVEKNLKRICEKGKKILKNMHKNK